MREQGVFFAGRWLLCLLLLGLSSPALAGFATPEKAKPSAATAPPDEAALRKLLQKLKKLKEPDDYGGWLFERLDLEDPYRVLLRAARESIEPAHAIAKLRERYTLNEAEARGLLIGQLAYRPPGQSLYESPEGIQFAMNTYREALKQAPSSLVLLVAMLSLPPAYETQPEELEASVLSALDSAPSPVGLALQLSRGGGGPDGWGVSLAAYAVSRQPDVLPRALETLGLDGTDRRATLFYFAAYQALRSRPQPAVPPALTERLLRNLVSHELPSLVVELVRQLPASQREELLAGRSSMKERDEGYSVNGMNGRWFAPDDLRNDISAALLSAGEGQGAKEWFESARTAPLPMKDGEPAGEVRVLAPERDLLALTLDPKPGSDPFEILMETGIQGMRKYPWDVLLAQQLQAWYPERARRLLSSAVNDERGEKHPEMLPLREHLTFLDAALAAFDAADKARLAQLEAALAAVPARASDSKAARPDPMASRIRELLAAPPASPFTEHPLSEAPKPKGPARWRPVKSELKPPDGFYPVRAERSGKRVLLLALSQRLDPAGEVSGGGYWLLESKDRGRTWDSPLYTGLRQYRPYELAKRSSLPMLDGDTLQLEASVRELEEQSITFPPLGLATKREQKGLFVRAPLAELQKDSDADGLPDLVEQRLLTDPNAADTDADGLPDGEDALPQVPAVHEGAQSPEASLLSAFITLQQGGEEALKGLQVGLPDEGAPPDELRLPTGPTPESRYDVTFLEMERGPLRGVRLSSRTIVLTQEELSAAQERFGRFYPLRIDIQLDAKGDQAVIKWDEHWRGGTYEARMKDGQWVFESRGEWIT